MFHNRKQRSFTNIELMIVVAIIIFLSSIALPNYFKYMARAKQAEVALNLTGLYMAQQTYFLEHGEYTTDFDLLHWKPKNGQCSYSYGFNNSEKSYIQGKAPVKPESFPHHNDTPHGFKAYALADLLGKGKYDIWSIDEDKNLVHIQNGID